MRTKNKVADLTVEELETIIHRVVEEEIEDLVIAFDPGVREKIQEGLKDVKEGRVISVEELVAQRKGKCGQV
jgi:predicted transcriptional regulator